jgi:hypothetical protein
MKIIPFVLFAALAAFTTRVAAESCHLSTACSGEEICINQECALPPGNLESCAAGENCEWEETCHDGYCKPIGVSCSNVAGSGHLRVSGGEINCMSGDGTGWENGMNCNSDDDTVNCVPPDINDLADMELEAMYEKCVTDLVNNCGAETPDPEEICSPEALQICTDWSAFIAEVDANCEDKWEIVTVERPSGYNDSADDSGDGDADSGDGDEDGASEEPVDSNSESSGSEDEIPRISGLFAARGLAATANPWFIAECCDAMADEDESEEIQMIQGMIESCAAELSASDCDSFEMCVDRYYEENGVSLGDSSISSNGKDDRDGTDELAQEAGSQATDSPTGDSSTNESGCSIAHIYQPIMSLLSLIF